MTPEKLRVEQLDNGLKAVFINLPHFRTHSARLIVNAGSMHETPEAYGAAHFLEHVTFQGTEALPNEEDVHRYTQEKGLQRNAHTSLSQTIYMADGYELESVGFFVSQIAFKPILSAQALERERKPIIDELQGYASSPYFLPNIAHNRATRGELYSRPIGGAVEDVQRMTPEALRSYHRRHYNLGNAVLVICSADPVKKQREFGESLVTGFEAKTDDEPNFVELDKFNPRNLDVSLQQVDLPLTAQTSVSISYGVPETSSSDEWLGYNLIGVTLSQIAHSRLRRELALCYGAGAGVSRLADLNCGRDKNWSHLWTHADLNGEDAVTGLETIYHDVINKPLPEKVFESMLVVLRRDVDHLMQNEPTRIADTVRNILISSRREVVELDEVERFASDISLDSLKILHKNLTDTKPLVIATSPSPKVLESVGDWANSRLQK